MGASQYKEVISCFGAKCYKDENYILYVMILNDVKVILERIEELLIIDESRLPI